MAPTKSERRYSVDELAEAIVEAKVMDAITVAFKPSLAELLDESVNDKLSAISASLTSLLARYDSTEKTLKELVANCLSYEKKLNDLSTENKSLLNRVTVLESENKSMDKRIRELCVDTKNADTKIVAVAADSNNSKKELSELLCYSYRDNLMIYGLPPLTQAEAATSAVLSHHDQSQLSQTFAGQISSASTNESTEQSVLHLFNDVMHVTVEPGDISVAHRLPAGNRRSVSPGTDTTPRGPGPVIVKFTRRSVRDQVYSARRSLKSANNRIFINEHLTQENAKLFKRARELVKQSKLASAWTMNGNVFTKDSALPTSRPRRVLQMSDLPQ